MFARDRGCCSRCRGDSPENCLSHGYRPHQSAATTVLCAAKCGLDGRFDAGRQHSYTTGPCGREASRGQHGEAQTLWQWRSGVHLPLPLGQARARGAAHAVWSSAKAGAGPGAVPQDQGLANSRRGRPPSCRVCRNQLITHQYISEAT